MFWEEYRMKISPILPASMGACQHALEFLLTVFARDRCAKRLARQTSESAAQKGKRARHRA